MKHEASDAEFHAEMRDMDMRMRRELTSFVVGIAAILFAFIAMVLSK
jgi:hypothetical protein